MLTKAQHWLDVGKPQRCLEELERLGADALTAEGFLLRATAYVDLERWQAAVDACRRGLDEEPEHLDLMYVLALAVEEVGDEVESERLFLRCLKEQPNSVRFLTGYANLMCRFHELEKADRLLDRAAAASPESIEVDLARVQLEFARGSNRKATEWAYRALEKDPENLAAMRVAGTLDSMRGQSVRGSRQLRAVASQRLGDQEAATAARHATIESHFLMWPIRLINRVHPLFRGWAAIFLGMAVFLPIAAVLDKIGAPDGLVTACIVLWFVSILYFWFAGPVAHLIVRRRNR